MRIGLLERATSWRRARREARQPPGTSTDALLPSYALDLFKFTHFAVGDETTATKLLAAVLAQAPESAGQAVRLLVTRLPKGRLSWPNALNPGVWVTPGIKHEQADRLRSALSEWSTLERLALALYLLWDVPHDKLDQWLGTAGIAQCIAEKMRHAGSVVGLVEPTEQYPACAAAYADLLEACEQRPDPRVRLHLLGCARCQRDIATLQQTTLLLRQVLQVFSRVIPPSDLAHQVAAHQHQRQLRFTNVDLPFVLVIVLLSLALSIVLRPNTNQPPPQVTLSAREVLNRALHRFEHGPQQGVLHERVRSGHGGDVLYLERWYDYAPPHRLHVTLRRNDAARPLLNLSTDGKSWVGYIFAPNYGSPDEAFIRDPSIGELLPLLRQLPFTGGFGGMTNEQDNIDLTLLAQARHGQLALHGVVQSNGRPAYALSSLQDDRTRLMLTIDRETFSLLKAYSISQQGGATRTASLWQAEIVEVLPHAPSDAFDSPTDQVMQVQLDPRRLAHRRAPNLDFHIAIDSTALPIPTALPEPPILASLRRLDWPIQGVLQLYDSEWSSLAIVVPTSQYHPFTTRSLRHEFEHGRFTVLETNMPAVTFVEFSFEGIPDRHVLLYYWHGLLNDAEREAMVVEILNAMELADQNNASAYSQRFGISATSGRPADASSFASIATPPRTLPISLTPERRYLRLKLSQTQRS